MATLAAVPQPPADAAITSSSGQAGQGHAAPPAPPALPPARMSQPTSLGVQQTGALPRSAGQQHRRDRHRRYYMHRQRQTSTTTVAGWLWLKICSHVRKGTVNFFDAVDAGRVERVRTLIADAPQLLLRSRPGTRWTALHYVAERGEYAMLALLLDEARRCEELEAVGSKLSCGAANAKRSSELVKRMVDALTEKNLTPLMLACKRGCAARVLACLSKRALRAGAQRRKRGRAC